MEYYERIPEENCKIKNQKNREQDKHQDTPPTARARRPSHLFLQPPQIRSRLFRPGPKNRAPDPHTRAPVLQGGFEIGGHPHAQLELPSTPEGPHELSREFAQTPLPALSHQLEVLRATPAVVGRPDRHQSPEPEPRALVDDEARERFVGKLGWIFATFCLEIGDACQELLKRRASGQEQRQIFRMKPKSGSL